MRQFYQEVDTSNRQEMIQFLENHFKYRSCGMKYAHNVKVDRLGLPRDLADKAEQLTQAEDTYHALSCLIHEFCEVNQEKVFFAGKSGGYLTLDSVKPFIFERDVEDVSDEELKAETEIVMLFDNLCDELLAEFIYLCNEFEVKTIVEHVPTSRTILVPKETSAQS